MVGATLTSDPLPAVGPGARRLAVRCPHATTEFDYCPAGLPPVLRLSEGDVARLVLLRHAAVGGCGCTAAIPAPIGHGDGSRLGAT
jgi:hypothetical protein